MSNTESTFNYTYSARDKEYLEGIKMKYSEKPENKVEQIKKLDAEMTRKPTIVSLIIGILGSLVMGTGMSMCMVWTDTLLVLGIVIGVIGIGVACLAYPIYNLILKGERDRLAPIILSLCDELLEGKES